MLKIASIENCPSWSWSTVVPELAFRLPIPAAELVSVFQDQDKNIKADLNEFDLVLLQNVDALKHITPEIAPRTLVRLGGLAMTTPSDLAECTKYDAALSSVGAVVSTNLQLHALGTRNNLNAFVIPNGVDLQRFKPALFGSNYQKFRVGFAGNISTSFAMQYKGYHLVAGAVTELYDTVDFVTALFGPAQVAHSDMVSNFYHRIDCLVSASENEGCSNVIMEALACGVPVICTQVGYHGEMLTHESNCLFIDRSLKAITEAVERLRTDTKLFNLLRKNGREFAVQYHDIRKTAQAYANIFRMLLQNQTKDLVERTAE